GARLRLEDVAVQVGMEARHHLIVRGADLPLVGFTVDTEELEVRLLVELGVLLLDPALDRFPPGTIVDRHQDLAAGALALTDDVPPLRRAPSGAPRTWMRAWVARPVFTSRARTCRMPSVSTVKVTSISASPRGRAGMPSSVRVPSGAFSANLRDSPWHTWMTTSVWLSCEATKTRWRSTGIGVFFSRIASA